jgi:hydroxyacyl-ACP dehydratase HTD2-like protein with hotdog domain
MHRFAAQVRGRHELAPTPGVHFAFFDPSGGSSDSNAGDRKARAGLSCSPPQLQSNSSTRRRAWCRARLARSSSRALRQEGIGMEQAMNAPDLPAREAMEFDVVIVGAGPLVVEKGSEEAP